MPRVRPASAVGAPLGSVGAVVSTDPKDLTGRRFGELTVIGRTERVVHERGVHWLLRCDCGGEAIRTTTQLNQAHKLGSSPCCHSCLVEWRRGRLHEIRERVHNTLRVQWSEHRTLWTWSQEEALEDRVRADMAAEFGEVEDDMRPEDMVLASGWRSSKAASVRRDELAMSRDELAKNYNFHARSNHIRMETR